MKKITYSILITLILISSATFVYSLASNKQVVSTVCKLVTCSQKVENKITTQPEIKPKNYQLENPTMLESEIISQLDSLYQASSLDYKEIASQLARLAAVDIFDWSNKTNRNDVGGVELVLNKEKYQSYVYDLLYTEYYRDFLEYQTKYGQENLPLVTSVDVISASENKYFIEDETVDNVYRVDVEFKYDESRTMDTTDLPHKVKMAIVFQEDKAYLAKLETID